jgi:hypothetical protein
MANDFPINHEQVTALANELGRPAKTLITEANTDPFYIAPARRRWAEWFAARWSEHGFREGVHLRRIHYFLVSLEAPVLDINGQPYVNDGNCWSNLKSASRDARYLGLVPIGVFVDQRTDDAVIHLIQQDDEAASVEVASPDEAVIPEAEFEPAEPLLVANPDAYVRMARFSIEDVEFPEAPQYTFNEPVISQRYHIEIWAEKTTVADVLISLARQYRLNVVMGAGDLSLTHCHQFVQRAKCSGKSVRVLYVADFDPRGRNMPVGVARKIDFLIRREQLDLDVQVRSVALTHEQCVNYQLPRIPIKDTDACKERFEERFGEGATELDALEAIAPGTLREVLVEEIERYHDDDIDDRVEEASADFEASLEEARNAVIDRHSEELEAVRADRVEIVRGAQERVDAIISACDEELRPLLRDAHAEIAPVFERHNAALRPIIERRNAEIEEIGEQVEADLAENAARFDTIQGAIARELTNGGARYRPNRLARAQGRRRGPGPTL